MNWFKKIFNRKRAFPQLPDTAYWKAYQQTFEPGYTKKTVLSEVRFVVLDTETTGLNVEKDKILSIGAVAVKNQKIYIAERFEYYVQQVYEGRKAGIKIHGILPKHTANAQSPKAVLIALLGYLQNSVLVGHHIGFDVAVLNRAFQQHLNGQLQNQTIDTAHLAKRLQTSFYNTPTLNNKHVSLDELCKQYNIPVYNRHTASGDALITAVLFLKLMAQLKKRGIDNWAALFRSGF